jgi:hypothetical protein
MANITITNNDLGSVLLQGGDIDFRDELLAFPGADTYLEGTLLARKQVADAVVAAADGGNTGDGTVTLATVAAGSVIPLVGAYNFECTAAVANGGVFKLVDPNGALVASDIILDVPGPTVVEVAGLTFTVTDGAADFIVGDKFSLTVAADGDMVAYAVAGAGGAQVAKSVLTYEVTVTGAEDKPIRALKTGHVRKERLVIDGSAAGVGITNDIIDQLQDVSIIAQDVQELNQLDNQ